MQPQRPAGTTSWVQMSAAGATPLGPVRRQLPQLQAHQVQQQQQQQQQQLGPANSLSSRELSAGEPTKLSFLSTTSSGSTSSSTSSSTASGSLMNPAGGLAAAAASSRLTSVLGGHSPATSAGPLGSASGQPLSLQSHSSSSAGNSSLASSASHQPHPADTQQMGRIVSPMQQMQAAMNELQLTEQQLGLKYSAASNAGSNAGSCAELEAAELQQEQQREANRKLRLQLYVFVLRCISYPFNAKQTATGDHRQQMAKLRKSQLEQIIGAHNRFIRASQSFLAGKCAHSHLKLSASQLKQLDELYERAHLTFNRRFVQNERLRLLVEAECCSQQDLRDLFRQNAERILKESSLFQSAQQQAQMAGHQQQHRSFMGSASNSSSRFDEREDSLSRLSAGPLDEQLPGVSSSAQLLANKEAILNSWQIKFESIVREDPGATGEAGPTSGSPSALLASGGSSGALSALGGGGGGSGSATPTQLGHQSCAGLQQQQQQQLQPLTKEQLYQMFQNILNVKKFEHQLLYNALQLDSADEQAAAIRRELDGRVARIAELERNKKLLPKFVLKEMESLFLDETRMAVNKLMVNLDSLPVMKAGGASGGLIGGPLGLASGSSQGTPGSSLASSGVYSGLQKFRRYNSRAQASLTRDGLAESHPSEPALTKLDVILTFNIEVIVMEVRGLRNIAPQRQIYCTMDIEGSETGRLQTEHVQAKKPLWDTQGDFTTTHPLPVLKIKLYAVNPSMLSLEDKELGKLVLRPTVLSPKTPEWCGMVASSGSDSGKSKNCDELLLDHAQSASGGPGAGAANDNQLKIRVIVRMDRPQQLKHCGFLWGKGKAAWLKFKRRYHVLIQVSQYTFVMCDFRDKKAKPCEMLQLDGYTVDYIEPPTDLITDHCSEITSAEHQHHSSHGSSTFGLAGRLAKPFLKQTNSPSSCPPVTTGSSLASGEEGARGGLGGDSYANAGDEQPSAIQTAAALSDELHNKFYFSIVKEGDSVIFGCDDEQECFGWVMALYRATGQAHKPTPLRDQYSSSNSHYLENAFAYQTSVASMMNGTGSGPSHAAGSGPAGSTATSLSAKKSSVVDVADQRARKHGMDEFISADPWKFQHNQLFKQLQNETLQYRLNDQFCSMGWFSSGQLFALDEYCARYGVRTCYRHLAYLNSLLDFNQRGYFIDHTLLNYGYDFCSSFVSGQSGALNPMSSVNFDLRPDGTVGTVTVEERDLFHCVKTKLLKMIERQIANFAYCFPYGKPEGSLKAALSLLERVLMKQETMNQMNSMVQNEEVRNLIRKCLEQAALNDYTKLSGQANLAAPVATSGPVSSGQQASESATQRSGQSTPSAADSPVPQANTSELVVESLAAGRKRAQSTLSNSSSIVSSSYSMGAASGTQSVGSFNDSMRRFNNNNASSNNTNSQQRTGVNTNMQPATGEQQQQQQYCVTMAQVINNDQVRPREKLIYLIRLAELCCEQVEENNEYFADAFAWHSDLMMDHFELFWSLFSVDMDKVLAELGGSSASLQSGGGANQQGGGQQALGRTASSSSSSAQATAGTSTPPAGTGSQGDLLGISNRDIFALFQVLNNHMRKGTNLECRKFKAYLCDTFKPKLLRYIDIMESTLTRMVFKACEKEAQVNCQMVEHMFQRLDELQRFVLAQLRWPDEQLAEQLHQRLKLISYELCDASVQRTLQAFQQLERKSNKWTATTTSYNTPVEMIQMINLTLDTRNRSLKLCTFNGFDQMSYNSKIDKLVETALGEMQPGLMAKMLNALDSTLNKLARFDEGNLLAPILSLTYKQGMSSSGRDIGKQYASFVTNCCDLIRHKINDEIWIVTLLEDWYAAQMTTICNWLSERLDHSLHDVQLVALTMIMPKVLADMSLQGVSEDKLNLKTYQTIMSRLKMEEAASVASGTLFEQPSTSIFNTSILSSLTSSANASSSAQQTAPSGPSNPVGSQQATGQQQMGGYNNIQSTGARRQMGSNSFCETTNQNLMEGEQGDNNIADRALQSATRIFKGFWNQ